MIRSTRIHANALLFGVMLGVIQLVILLVPGQPMDEGWRSYIPLMAYMVTGNGGAEGVQIEHLVAGTGMMSPMAGMIWVMKHFATRDDDVKED